LASSARVLSVIKTSVARTCAWNAAIMSTTGSVALAGSGGILGATDVLRREVDVGGRGVDMVVAHQRLEHREIDHGHPGVWRSRSQLAHGD
jgi:hypothetical protein